ncbi:MAG: 3-isopropylmalate dehydratase [Lentisphaerae bacterium]|jgi:3-isopropylmalate/(R)-2-methylmalate dehydratase small subunit|nr:3-isopropylmalate dehydratase [Lentisphaerota bacterium]
MNQKNNILRAKVYVAGDNIDTDQIIPAHYLNLVPTIPEEYAKLGSYAMAGLPSTALPFIDETTGRTPYGIMIAGRNFGCGSSREHAPVAIGAAGCKAIVAESYARIFFRNCVATGEAYPYESETLLTSEFKTGDEAEINTEEGTITRVSDGAVFKLKEIGAVGPVIAAGGMFKYAREIGIIKQG